MMTQFQDLFIKNLRFHRKRKGISQIDFSKLVDISPNYLNAVEKGKNFPSPEVIQRIADSLEILPYQLFLEQPEKPRVEQDADREAARMVLIHELNGIKRRLVGEINGTIQKYRKH